MSFEHRAEADRVGRDDRRRLERHVGRADLAGVDGILDDSVEAEQVGHALAVQRPARIGEHGGAHRAAIEPLVELVNALGVARERGFIAQEVIRIAGGLRLHAVGIGRHDGIDVLRRNRQHARAHSVQGVGEIEQLVAKLRHPVGGVHVLAASPRMNEGSVGAD